MPRRPQRVTSAILGTMMMILTVSDLVIPTVAVADTLDMPAQPGTEQPATDPAQTTTPPSTSVTLPGRGMTMEQVESRFGAPRQRLSEVGDPPIIRWVYPRFSVYFEYQYVIHAVMHSPARPAPNAPPQAEENNLPDSTAETEAQMTNETSHPAMAQ